MGRSCLTLSQHHSERKDLFAAQRESHEAGRPHPLVRRARQRRRCGRYRSALRGTGRHGLPPRQPDGGRDAIRGLWEKVLANAPHFEQEPPLPTLISGDIALTATPPKDGAGARAQVARRQPDGTWLRLLDQPEFISPAR